MNIWLKVLIFVLIFIILISLMQFIVSVRPPRHYSSNTPDDVGLEFEEVSFKTSDGIKIAGWWIPNPKVSGTVIVGHGYPFDKGNVMPSVSFLASSYNLLLYDHRYFGESSGSITTVGVREVKDIEAAMKFVEGKGPIGFMGFSMSASAMLMHCSGNAIIADSPYASLDNMVKVVFRMFGPLKYPFVLLTNLYSNLFLGIDPSSMSPVDKVVDCKIPVLLIHGSLDSQIPVSNSRELKAANPDIEYWEVAGADHGAVHAMYPDEYEEKVLNFLKKNMK